MFEVMNEDKVAIIMRGLPGSGKSYWVSQYLDTHVKNVGLEQAKAEVKVFSTDQFFVNNGIYTFNAALLSKYHQMNLTAFIEAMSDGVRFVICDNTNIALWEFAAYRAAAKALGYKVIIKQVGIPSNFAHQQLCANRNRHRVTLNSIKRMATLFETIDHI
ncbi:AAA family ATPase [Shewanella youngdeokensis]|uniref:AAA family ATPase n=1 Tax=Shewanella youngdeokensis TaxID=2999068 RepID=A0ABZ0JUB4_9GAMM|nr:AAA family ATPase [Shewanella sp. DAU334]